MTLAVVPVATGSQTYVLLNGAVPPLGTTVISPVFEPLQSASTTALEPNVIAVGSVNSIEIVSSQPLESVTVTIYFTPPSKFMATLSIPT